MEKKAPSYFEGVREYVAMPRKLIFGPDSVKQVGKEVKRFGNRTLVVTDEGVRKAGLVDKVTEVLLSEGIEFYVFDGVKTEPDLENARVVAKVSRERSYDVVLGVGGGSCLDMAKVATVMATNEGDVEEYFGDELIKRPGLPLILIPTTSGSGSEATRGSVISVGDIKKVIFSRWMIAEAAIVDPLMTLTMPPRLTAITGIDALSHAVESILSRRSNIVSLALAKESVSLVFKGLEAAYRDGKDVNARYRMAMAATFAGASFANSSVVLGHGISYALSTLFHVPHGLGCGIALPYVMEYNIQERAEELRDTAAYIGLNVEGLDDVEAAKTMVRVVANLIRKVGLPISLREMDIPKDSVAELAGILISRYQRLLINNPREVTYEDAIKLFSNIWEGRLESLG
ncbi:MAG: iron-containing alcohol dehydrogenase [Nitrososphaerota archaeon]|nr:iron-containing alcohol dehydrogenase [Aigarchaeota archaeon]MDW8076714.1 iron-containing alcohol dehydrogenase [Nitrososphaerota archaeon]